MTEPERCAEADRISLAPLTPEEALRALLAVKREDNPPKATAEDEGEGEGEGEGAPAT